MEPLRFDESPRAVSQVWLYIVTGMRAETSNLRYDGSCLMSGDVNISNLNNIISASPQSMNG